MQTCLHRDVTVQEFGNTTLEWYFENAVAQSSYQRPGSIQSKVHVTCHDCGLNKDFSRRTAPEWVKEYLSYIDGGGATEDIRAFEKEIDRRNATRFSRG